MSQVPFGCGYPGRPSVPARGLMGLWVRPTATPESLSGRCGPPLTPHASPAGRSAIAPALLGRCGTGGGPRRPAVDLGSEWADTTAHNASGGSPHGPMSPPHGKHGARPGHPQPERHLAHLSLTNRCFSTPLGGASSPWSHVRSSRVGPLVWEGKENQMALLPLQPS